MIFFYQIHSYALCSGVHEFWYIACRSKQLDKKPISRVILGKHIVLFRQHAGTVAALIDRCPHRNLALSRGTVTKKGLRCAYHGWSWAADGHCSDIPASCADCASYAKINVRSFVVIEKQGFIWLWMGAGAVIGEPLDFPYFYEDNWQHWVMERHFAGNAFHCVENFLDVPHTAHVHRGLFRGEESKEIEIEITSGENWIQAAFVNEQRMDSIIGKMLVPKNEKIVHTDRFQLPYVTRVDYRMTENRQYVVMSQCTPVNEVETRVYTYMAMCFAPFGNLARWLVEPVSRVILNQDVTIIKQQTYDLKKTGAPKFIYFETDAIAQGIRDLLDGKSLANRPPIRKKIKA